MKRGNLDLPGGRLSQGIATRSDTCAKATTGSDYDWRSDIGSVAAALEVRLRGEHYRFHEIQQRPARAGKSVSAPWACRRSHRPRNRDHRLGVFARAPRHPYYGG